MGVYISEVFSNTPSVCSVYASLLVGLCIATLMPEQHLHHKGLQGYLRPSAPFMALHWIINGFKNLKMVFWPPRVWYICISTFVRFESAKSFLKSFKPFFKFLTVTDLTQPATVGCSRHKIVSPIKTPANYQVRKILRGNNLISSKLFLPLKTKHLAPFNSLALSCPSVVLVSAW